MAAVGGFLSVLSSVLSALGGIYNEKLLKGRPSSSIHWQNIQMYVWGVAFNALGFAIKDGGSLANGWSSAPGPNGDFDRVFSVVLKISITDMESTP